jgi:hypothetical protein
MKNVNRFCGQNVKIAMCRCSWLEGLRLDELIFLTFEGSVLFWGSYLVDNFTAEQVLKKCNFI